jgi:hypothetical protein
MGGKRLQREVGVLLRGGRGFQAYHCYLPKQLPGMSALLAKTAVRWLMPWFVGCEREQAGFDCNEWLEVQPHVGGPGLCGRCCSVTGWRDVLERHLGGHTMVGCM